MLKGFLKTLAEIIYPRYCLLCRKRNPLLEADEPVCSSCISKIRPITSPFCKKCGRKILRFDASGGICALCCKSQFHFDRAFAGYPYEGVIKELIHQFKYKNKIALGKRLSGLLIEFTEEYSLPLDGCDYVIPIPLYRAKLREREFNQARILARYLSCHYKLTQVDNNLQRIRNTATQTELDKSARLENVRGAFKLKNPQALKDKTILLIDDVLTTGATASEAAGVLKSAGASAVYVLTLAN